MRVKICGITTPADAESAARLGADAVGLNFYLKSPRFITREQAQAILTALPPMVEPVGVLVQPDAAQLVECSDVLRLRILQFHQFADIPMSGNESWRRGAVIPAYGIRDRSDLAEVTGDLPRWRAAGVTPAAVLLDARVEGMHGGTGKTAPWSVLAGYDPGVPVILAGGLTPENVAEAIRIVRPYAVDVASGVESLPGFKDVERVRRFIGAVREAAAKHNV